MALAVVTGLRKPVVVILLAIAFFTSISGKPLDGLLMLAVGVSLAWDAGRAGHGGGNAATGAHHGEGTPGLTDGWTADTPAQPPRHRPAFIIAAAAAAAGYVVVAGSFARYSWPATVAVLGVGACGVLIGWRGPRRHRDLPGSLPMPGTALWAVVFVAGCLWELAALLGQPTLTTSSYLHPTISTLTDPLLAAAAGRSALLLVWLALGWYLVER